MRALPLLGLARIGLCHGRTWPSGILLILGIALLLFGPKKLNELGKSLGVGIRSFRSAVKEEPPKG